MILKPACRSAGVERPFSAPPEPVGTHASNPQGGDNQAGSVDVAATALPLALRGLLPCPTFRSQIYVAKLRQAIQRAELAGGNVAGERHEAKSGAFLLS